MNYEAPPSHCPPEQRGSEERSNRDLEGPHHPSLQQARIRECRPTDMESKTRRQDGKSYLDIFATIESFSAPAKSAFLRAKHLKADSNLVGATGFEPVTPCAQGRCATRLRYAPTIYAALPLLYPNLAAAFFACQLSWFSL
jgi:hypothetical protein